MAKHSWLSPYVSFKNNPIYFADPRGLEGEPKNKKNSSSHMNLSEVTVVAKLPKNSVTITREAIRQEPSLWQSFLNFLGIVQEGMQGDARFNFGIEFKTHDGLPRGNSNPNKIRPENFDKT